MVFILSYAFQISGAIILLLWSFASLCRIKIKVLDLYFPDSSVIERDNDDMCILSKDKLRKATIEIFKNIFAFLDLVIGYSLAIFAEQKFENCKAFLLIVISTALITVIECLATGAVARLKYPKDVVMPFAEIEKCKPDIGTFITDREVKEMCDKIFGDESKG